MPSYLELLGMIHIIYITIGSIISLILYKKDKQLAKENKERIKERTLLFASVFGGGVGSLLARTIYHHKTNKIYFSIIIYTSVLFELIFIFIYLYFLLKGAL